MRLSAQRSKLGSFDRVPILVNANRSTRELVHGTAKLRPRPCPATYDRGAFFRDRLGVLRSQRPVRELGGLYGGRARRHVYTMSSTEPSSHSRVPAPSRLASVR